MTWRAVYLPDSKEDPTECGFENKEAAEDFVRLHCCELCVNMLEDSKNGLVSKDDEYYLEDLLDSSCAAEWHIEEEKEYNLGVYIKEADDEFTLLGTLETETTNIFSVIHMINEVEELRNMGELYIENEGIIIAHVIVPQPNDIIEP